MKKELAWLLMALCLASAPVFVSAQDGPGPGPGVEEEIEMMDEGPGGPGPGPGMSGEPGGWKEEGGMGQKRRVMKKKMMMRGPQGMDEGFFPEEKVLAVIKKHDPAFAGKVAELRDAAPARYKMLVQMAGKMFAGARMEENESLEKDAVRGLALEFESKELSFRYNKASDAEKREIKAKLGKVLAELFDLRNKGQELRVKRMEEDLGRLKKKLESRKANKAKIVEERLQQMTGEGYSW